MLHAISFTPRHITTHNPEPTRTPLLPPVTPEELQFYAEAVDTLTATIQRRHRAQPHHADTPFPQQLPSPRLPTPHFSFHISTSPPLPITPPSPLYQPHPTPEYPPSPLPPHTSTPYPPPLVHAPQTFHDTIPHTQPIPSYHTSHHQTSTPPPTPTTIPPSPPHSHAHSNMLLPASHYHLPKHHSLITSSHPHPSPTYPTIPPPQPSSPSLFLSHPYGTTPSFSSRAYRHPRSYTRPTYPNSPTRTSHSSST
ncbi:hypothetical protein Pcinc_007320 [Petrolisthes cinctipes]|uniref:Uncharacterized protein n=1 Tax=Petrolisthes cinctipes TaxID=88211 RepID=A0AAE1KXH2_PETCI|nr:hypothetical protein Pcinc_007320 [Petrolisthes cinctipes]